MYDYFRLTTLLMKQLVLERVLTTSSACFIISCKHTTWERLTYTFIVTTALDRIRTGLLCSICPGE